MSMQNVFFADGESRKDEERNIRERRKAQQSKSWSVFVLTCPEKIFFQEV